MRIAPVLSLTALVWVFVPATVHAAFIPWKYDWTRDKPIIYSDTSKKSYVTLSDEGLTQAAGSSDIVATNLKVFSDADPSNPATFTNKTYSLTLFLLDIQSGKHGTLTFTGFLHGDISQFSSNLENTFTGPSTQTLVLGGHQYSVTMPYYTPPGPPGSTNSGSIAAHATVIVSDIQKTPEPASIVLVLCGLPGIGYHYWRRRRAAAATC
jgi:hypothetical protein